MSCCNGSGKQLTAMPTHQGIISPYLQTTKYHIILVKTLLLTLACHVCMLGTDIAVEAADYVLMRSDLEDVLTALDLSKKTFRRIYYNYGWAFIYNLLMVPLAAGVLYPPLHFQLPPWVRAFLLPSPCPLPGGSR